MSITVNIYYYGSKARLFAEEMEKCGIADQIRARAGNIEYTYYVPLSDNNYILLIDSWHNQAALDDHHNSDIMDKIIELRNKYDLTMKVVRYDEQADIPEFDQSFVV